jgi:predicted aldo/keto reductase-like oxidoreductase
MLTPESEVIRAGVDMGINYLDTARGYLKGRSEEIVSRALEGIRDKVYISTKSHGAAKDALAEELETSLKNLRTDHVDVFHLHGLDDPKRAFDPEFRAVLLKLRQQGKVRFFGVSTHTNQANIVNALADDPDKFFDVVTLGYNFKADPAIKQAIARAAKAGIGVVAMKTMAGGYQTTEMGSITPYQAALKWVLQDTNVTAAIPGMKTLANIQEMMPVMGMKLTSADERALRNYSKAIDPYYCRLCAECEKTCPKGVRISVVNRALMYAEGYKEHGLGRATFREADSASACTGCNDCVARCVNGLDIAEKMRRARSLLA